MTEVCPFISIYFLIEKRCPGCTATCTYRCIRWRGLKRNFIPPFFCPDLCCSLTGMLRFCFRASGSLSVCGSRCQKEAIKLHGATNLGLGTGVGWGWREAYSCYTVCMQDLISLPSSWFLWSICLEIRSFSSKEKTPNFPF